MIVLYSRQQCGSCVATKRTLKKLELEFEEIDVTGDDEAEEELRQMGATQMPVVIAGDVMITGYRPDLLRELAK